MTRPAGHRFARTRQLTSPAVIGGSRMSQLISMTRARTRSLLRGGAVTLGAAAVGIGVLAAPASAAPSHDWSGVANCESGGNWSINTGNGFYGGLQFSQPTLAGVGGTSFAPRADLATPSQQVKIAEKGLGGQGIGAWPTCGKLLTGGTTATADAAPAPAPAPTPAPAAAAAPAPAAQQPTAAATTTDDDADDHDAYGRDATPAGDYTVKRGDTVAKIAAAHHQQWRELYQSNLSVIGSTPNRIYPGQVLATSGKAQEAAAPAAIPAPAEAPAAAPAAAPAQVQAAVPA